MKGARAMGWAVLTATAGLAAACSSVSSAPPSEVPDGNPERGAGLIQQYGCASCHSVPGVRGADGLVGPPLDHFGSRSYIAGQLPNNGQNLQRWIRDPQAVEPGTAMPGLGVTPLDARDIAAYLFTLE
ncbi:c-type cytochrome [Amycolatopsis thermoflava]|uniref:c-type cytochrome n=1 Tax=Amycolatopsis thermoflava TaxID=84480 RepID=UPI003EBFFC89